MKKILTACALLTAFTASAQNPDASSFSAGNTIPVNPAAQLSCDGYDAYQQPLDDAFLGTARTADEELGFTVHESMVDGSNIITPMINGEASGIRIWGLSLEFDPNLGFVDSCTEDYTALTPYTLTFSDDNAGVPGNVLATVTATVSNVRETGIPFAFTTIQEIDLAFPNTDMTNVAWVSVQRQTGVGAGTGNSCLFLWPDETDGTTYDNLSLQDDGINPPVANGTDQTMCLALAPEPPAPVPTLSWYSIILLLMVLVLFSRKALLNDK
jgi:hypothetical protein